ncbi:putative NODULIN-LIKE PROTEIN [Salix purpurea]|uniref:NODULIN-LIKE PROTEIN n=1 Tax=Salix purpurea TaxID=77065 RepID=A0A9Q0VGN5_SALPP|nr:putative NODULIN-LIKE PROTEIN [Salix purpurea]
MRWDWILVWEYISSDQEHHGGITRGSLIGAVQNFVGYGLVWLIVAQKVPALPLWVVIVLPVDLNSIISYQNRSKLCVAIFVGTNGETYFNTVALVSCVQNFPKNRGPVVGILKGFAGLSGAILTQIYAMINSPNQASLIFMIAVGPSMVVIAIMFVVRPSRDLVNLDQTLLTLLAVVLIILVLLPITIPVLLAFYSEPRHPVEENLLPGTDKQESSKSDLQIRGSFILSESEDEKPSEMDLLQPAERHRRIAHLQAKLFQAAAEGAVRVKRRKGQRRGEDFTLMQALIKADFLLMFFSLVLASGSGLTVIDNLGQICQSLGYTDTSIFVSMISIWNFLGRVGGGYFSEAIIRKYAYPRPVAMAVVQDLVMALTGQSFLPLPLSFFGLKSLIALYNFLTLSSPAGSLIFSGVMASGLYDYYAKKQAGLHQIDSGSLPATHLSEKSLTCVGTECYSLTCGIMSGLCIIAVILSLIVVRRTKSVYAQLYGNVLV